MGLADWSEGPDPAIFEILQHQVAVQFGLLCESAELLHKNEAFNVLAHPKKADSCFTIIAGHQ
jgi:hypothetical protein